MVTLGSRNWTDDNIRHDTSPASIDVLERVYPNFAHNIFLGFGGGWQWGLIPLIRGIPSWINWEALAPWALSAISTHLLRLTTALVILAFLMLSGKKRVDFFLVKGKMNALVEPSKLIGMKKPEPWTRIGTIFAIIFITVTVAYLLLSSTPSLDEA